MTKLTHNLGAKILACFLVILSGITALGSGLSFFYAESYGFFGSSPKPYHETHICRNITYDYVQELVNFIDYGDWSYGEKEAFTPENTNFRYILKDTSGNVLLDNLSENEIAAFVEEYQFVLANQLVKNNGDLTEILPLDASMDIIVEGYLAQPLVVSDNYELSYWYHQNLYDIHSILLPLLLGSLLVFALCFVFLLCAAGHQAGKEEITPNLQDKLPLDLYLAVLSPLSPIVFAVGYQYNPFDSAAEMALAVFSILILAVLALATVLTCATRIKLGRYFYQNTICWRILCFFGKILRYFLDALKAIPAMWKVGVAWLVISSVYFGGGGGALLLNLVLTFVFCTIASQLQRLAEGGEALARGNLTDKIDTQRMFPPFRKHGEHLNSVSKGFSIALEQKMRSERMKTELITNVSHDIKTPLTSIINYVDLLKKEELTGQAAEYIEVLDRQSRRLKKLTEDLVEASKASTGNLKASLAPTDMKELVLQAVAEYEEKLEAARLEVVVSSAEAPLYAMVDGNLTWRVLSNLLSNACKYSQTGTRVYIDIRKELDFISISMKNISKDALNIPVEELMERFVRGDSSRHTEGSGLGLNIAQSLVHLQKGKFTLDIEGDLFKAYLKFPAAEPPAPSKEEQKNDTL